MSYSAGNIELLPARVPLTEERKEAFLTALSETGSFDHACRVASPHSDGRKPCYSTFRDEVRRSPEFAARVAEAKAEALGRVEREIFRRAVEGVETPVFQKGERVIDHDGRPAVVRQYSDDLLRRLAGRLDPENWVERRQIEHSGSVGQRSDDVLSLSVSDVLALSQRDRDDLGRILQRVAENRGEVEPGELIDVTPETVEEDLAAELEAIR